MSQGYSSCDPMSLLLSVDDIVEMIDREVAPTPPGGDGVARIRGEKVFVLRFLQARDPDWVGRPFFARYDERATWLTDLRPAFGEERFFFEEGLDAIKRRPGLPVWDAEPQGARLLRERY